MDTIQLRGVIAAAATPVTSRFEPDLDRFVDLCRWLLDDGCDALNICGTTGEATSFSLVQRMAIMDAAARNLPLERLMVGTGAAALDDAVTLTRHAASLGFAGALVIPPFYYKGIGDEGMVRTVGHIVEMTGAEPIDIYLYNFPALSGVAYSPALVTRLRERFGDRIAGLKDSSGDLSYASEVAAISETLRVFPSNEAILLRARAGAYAGCISASANVNAPWCAKAWRNGDQHALKVATTLRTMVSRKPLVASIKAVLAHLRNDPAFEPTMPPLMPLSSTDRDHLIRDVQGLLQDSAAIA